MDQRLLEPQVRAYLLKNIYENAASFLLRTHPFEIDNRVLVQQLIGLQKARTKFPFLYKKEQILYPPKVNLEQTSSWDTARYKAAIVDGDSMIDLTGGLGIDDIAFATLMPGRNNCYTKVIHVELNHDLQELAAHNFKVLELPIDSLQGDGIDHLQSNNAHFDLIYVDPSRKTDSNTKAIQLADYEPDVTLYEDLFLEKADNILIKTSPMLDITAGLRQLSFIAEIHIVAVKNEVKELLWLINKKSSVTKIIAVNLNTEQPVFNFMWNQNTLIEIAPPKNYLYEPNAAIMKSQAFGEICSTYAVSKIDQDAHLFTHDNIIEFPGRCFEIIKIIDYKPKVIKRQYGKGAHAVVVRNFRESVKKLRTIFNLEEHETNYLFFTSIANRGYVVIEAVKI